MSKKPKDKNSSTGKIIFTYQKTGSYRTYYIDGAYGGLTPKGYLVMQLYSEKSPLPDKETLDIRTNKSTITVKKEVLREVEAGLILDYQTMVSIRGWLTEKINVFEKKVTLKKPN